MRTFDNLVKAIVTVSALVLLSECAPSTTVATNKDQNYTSEPKRLLVVSALGAELGKQTDSFKATFVERIKDCGITANFIWQSGSTISDEDQQREKAFIQRFGPDSVLTVTETNYTRRNVSRNGMPVSSEITEIKYGLGLFDLASKKAVWKAEVDLETEFNPFVSTGDAGAELAKSIVRKLDDDKIFHSCPAQASR